MMNPYQLWISYKTIVAKDIRRVFRLWMQTFFPSVVTTSLYFIIFGYALGGMLKGGHHGDYAAFIAPGLVMLSMINSTCSGSSFAFFQAKFQKTIEEVLVSPTPVWLMLLAYMSIGIIRGFIIASIVSVISWFFTGFELYSFWMSLGVILLTGFVFSSLGLISGIYSDNFDQMSVLPNFILTPLIYLGGVFYSVQQLPGFWKTLSMYNPVYYVIDAFRHALLGAHSDHLTASILAIIAMGIALFAFAAKLFNSKVGVRP